MFRRWPVRVKLFAGLCVVVGMMLISFGGSAFGLHSFHMSYLTQIDQLVELDASTKLIQGVFRLHAPEAGDAGPEFEELKEQIAFAQQTLVNYHRELKKNALRGNRANPGTDELELAFLIDDDLARLRSRVAGREAAAEPILPGTKGFFERHPEVRQADFPPAVELPSRIERLHRTVSILPSKLNSSFYKVLENSRTQYQTSRAIVWSSAVMVLAMLCGLAALFHRWVLNPVRLLHKGVRRVARGNFGHKIDLHTGDEMQDFAEAFNDMTAQISMTYADLEKQVHERSQQLVRSEHLAGVGFLAAGVAHEINNPLASIAFCSEALENRLNPILEASASADHQVVTNYLRMIQEEAFRCKNITEKLLDFSRLNDIKREKTDLVGLVEGVVEMIRHMGKYRGKTIVFQPREAVTAHVDSQEIKQVVLNLVVNALDSMDERGVLRIDLRRNHGIAEMSFADNGFGMTPDVLANIFEPFFTKRRVGKGTGLGLSISHRIISQHNGEIDAASPGEGRGATFTVRIPMFVAEPVPDSSAAPHTFQAA